LLFSFLLKIFALTFRLLNVIKMRLFQSIQFISKSSLSLRVRTQTGKSNPPLRDYKPFFASLLQKRRIALILFCAVTIQTVLISVGLGGWQCPIHSTLGIPCPGCGLSTAITLLVKGDFQRAIHTHAFAPVFLLAFLIFGIVSILPENLHRKAVLQIAAIEKHTAFAAYIFLGIIIYWIYRLFAPYL
jgi:hypothetical protein